MSEINTVHTPCKNCVFATYNDKTQTDCALKYLDIYKQQNVDILDVYDDDKEFFVINNKKCIGYREPKWFAQFNLEDSSLQMKIDQYFKLNHLHYALVINLKEYTLQDLDYTISQISSLQVQPQKVVLIRYIEQKHLTYQNIQKILTYHNIQFEWRIQSMVDNNLSYIEILHNVVVTNNKYRFMVAVESPSEDVGEFITGMNKLVHQELKQFNVASTKDKKCLGFSTFLYRFGSVTNQHIFSNPDSYLII
jgi:hypothetical protein